MAEFELEGALALKVGDKKLYAVEGRDIILVRTEHKFFAVSNTCPHRGEDLFEGEVALDEGTITCPFHLYCYDLSKGTNINQQGRPLKTFTLRVTKAGIYLELE